MKQIGLKIFTLAILVIGGLIGLHFYLLDGLDGWIARLFVGDDTVYASGYSDKAFRRITQGMSKQDVVKLIGIPLMESWIYEGTSNGYGCLYFQNETVYYITLNSSEYFVKRVEKGMNKEKVLSIVGRPTEESWMYTDTPKDRSFRRRGIVFKGEQVIEKFHDFYVD